MKKLLFLFLSIVKSWQKMRRRISGKSEADIHAERVVSGKAWDEFCDSLKAAGA
ncbi:MAG: hypothetical protein ISR57_03515, partial [Bacteroidales bacterium]|nr:hypothetical protein [Bacteroidales bacterium]